MIKKKVLLFGTVGGHGNFFNDRFTVEYEIVALVVHDNTELVVTPQNNFKPLNVVNSKSLPGFVYNMVDGVLMVDETNLQPQIDFLLRMGVNPKKIIPWDRYGRPQFLTAQRKNGVVSTLIEGLEYHIRNDADEIFINQIHDAIQNQRRLYSYPIEYYQTLLTQQYQKRKKRPLQWNNLQTFTEKIQWLKLFDVTSLKVSLTDKYLVRHYVSEKIGAEYLTKFLGIWNNVDDININDLPEKFILKCTHGENMSIAVDKKSLDERNLREKFNAWLQVDYGAQFNFELQYSMINRKIVAEEFIDGNAFNYHFYCFHGDPIYCQFGNTFYNSDWVRPDFESGATIPEPKNFELMKNLAKKLCKEFTFVRIDFKEVDGKIYFHSFNFTPSEDMNSDKHLGSLIHLPNNPPFVIEFAGLQSTKLYQPEIRSQDQICA